MEGTNRQALTSLVAPASGRAGQLASVLAVKGCFLDHAHSKTKKSGGILDELKHSLSQHKASAASSFVLLPTPTYPATNNGQSLAQI